MMPKALVADDSRAVRMILVRTLKELGFEVREAGNGRGALEVIETEKTAVTLVLADWNMPEINGLELLMLLRQKPELSSLVLVMVTTETELDQMVVALEAGANEYVMKPFTKDILIEKLEREGIRLLVVDDSVVIRRLVAHALKQEPALEVVGAASNGAIALQLIPQLNPDILTLDIEMPEMDGLETLRRVRRE